MSVASLPYDAQNAALADGKYIKLPGDTRHLIQIGAGDPTGTPTAVFYFDTDSAGGLWVDVSGTWRKSPIGTPAAAMTTQLTSITIADAAGTPDYTIQAVINTNAYGFASAQEAISFLYVVQNLQARVAELEAIVEGFGLAAAN